MHTPSNPHASAVTPLIGVTLDYEEGGGYSKYPWYGLRDNYCTALSHHGAAPLPLPHEVAMVETYLDTLHGLVITGGNFDVPPEMYGETTKSDKVTLKQRRSAFERAITQGAVKRNMPILGICGGQQLLNVILGGTLIQHIPDTIRNPLAHEQPNPRHEPGHEVAIVANTLLYKIVGSATLAVNSAHHQAVATAAPGAVVNARASDGVIEGIEYPAHPFCLGVQWHPEFTITHADSKIFAAFVEAAKIYQDRGLTPPSHGTPC